MTSESQMTTVIATQDIVQQALFESVLRAAGVPYLVRNAGVQNLIGVGEIGGYNLATGPIEIQVPGAEVQRARELIAAVLEEAAARRSDLEGSGLDEAPNEDKPDDETHGDTP